MSSSSPTHHHHHQHQNKNNNNNNNNNNNKVNNNNNDNNDNNNENPHSISITPSQPIRSNLNFLTPPSPTTTTSTSTNTNTNTPTTTTNNLVNKLKHHVPKRLSLSNSSRSKSSSSSSTSISPIQSRQNSFTSHLTSSTNSNQPIPSILKIRIEAESIIFPKSITKSNLFKILVFDKDRLKNDYLGELDINLLDWFLAANPSISPQSIRFGSSENPSRWLNLISSKSRTKVTGQLLCQIGFLSPTDFYPTLNSLPPSTLSTLPFSPTLSQSSPTQKLDTLTLNISLILTWIALPSTPALLSGSVENETDDQDKQKRVSRILNSNKKLRAIMFKKIRRKSTEPTHTVHSGGAVGGAGEIEEVEVNEEGLVHIPLMVLELEPKGRIVSGQELSEAIGEDSPESDDLEDSLSSIISTDSESEDSEVEEMRSTSVDEKHDRAVQQIQFSPTDSELGSAFQPTSNLTSPENSTLLVPPTMSRSSSSSSRKLLSIPSALSKKIPSGIKALAPRSTSHEPSNQPIKSVRLTEPNLSPTTTRHHHHHHHNRAIGLPYWKAVTRIGFDMDPFVIISFGEKIFRTKVIRHSLEPVWDERLFFHVKREELSYTILFSLFDWDKMSSNDYIGEAKLNMSSLISENERMMSLDPITGLYKVDEHGKLIGDQMISFEFLINTPISNPSSTSKSNSSDPINPSPPSSTTLVIFNDNVNNDDYNVLEKVFRISLIQDESGTISKIELVSMLDSLGSTLSSETIESFFVRYGKSSEIESDVLSVDQVICCLEDELSDEEEEEEESYMPCEADVPLGFVGHNPVDTVIEKEEINERKVIEEVEVEESQPKAEEEEGEEEEEGKPEKVIQYLKMMEIDIVTHLAVCASTDWSTLRHILSPGNFVTSNQANRKWFTKVIGKVQNGKYSLGADSANIIVKDRKSGRLVEEKMQVGRSIRDPIDVSKFGIEIEDGKGECEEDVKVLDDQTRDEWLYPWRVFKTFNEFFYRELKPKAREIEGIGNPRVMVSCADCRMMVFENLGIGKSIWIKGQRFNLKKVLGETVWMKDERMREEGEAKEEDRWTIGIFRLAPQDYHRFHSPLDGIVEQIERIDGQYYTVNPMAIRSTIDVYGENVRVIIGFNTEGFGKVYCVLVGAMMVGSIEVGVKVGDVLKKGDHLGYFAFGGSTILVIGESELIEWDEDLLMNSRAPMETLVKVGNQVGVRKKDL
ncbi:phosphatidylserine decarboxylase-domain-containing protein [Melampsora americana]|nr:phosphatidylserine decarboxylase-domain-containing protein [Melampsora americana]